MQLLFLFGRTGTGEVFPKQIQLEARELWEAVGDGGVGDDWGTKFSDILFFLHPRVLNTLVATSKHANTL